MGAKVISEDSVKLTKTSKGIFFFFSMLSTSYWLSQYLKVLKPISKVSKSKAFSVFIVNICLYRTFHLHFSLSGPLCFILVLSVQQKSVVL